MRCRARGGARQNAQGHHRAAAARANVERVPGQSTIALAVVAGRFGRLWGWGCQQPAAQRRLAGAMAVGQEAEVADAVEPGRQDVEKEAPDELAGLQAHHLGLVVVPVILPAEANPAVLDIEQLVRATRWV